MKRYAWFRPSGLDLCFDFFGFDPSLRRPRQHPPDFAACFNLPRALSVLLAFLFLRIVYGSISFSGRSP